jgi:hypothetical protein
MQANYEGASRILCEWLQRVFGSVLVHSVKNPEKYSFAAVAGGEGSFRDCGTDAAVHFDKAPLDHVGGGSRRRCALGSRKQYNNLQPPAPRLRKT